MIIHFLFSETSDYGTGGAKRRLIIDESDEEVTFGTKAKKTCLDHHIPIRNFFMDEAGDNDIKHLRDDATQFERQDAIDEDKLLESSVRDELKEIEDLFKQGMHIKNY